MHEISIAESIIEIAEAKAREQNAVSIQLSKLRLGEFTSIVREALEFAFEIARQGTIAERAQLDIQIEYVDVVTEESDSLNAAPPRRALPPGYRRGEL